MFPDQLVNTIASAKIENVGVGERSGSQPSAKDDAHVTCA